MSLAVIQESTREWRWGESIDLGPSAEEHTGEGKGGPYQWRDLDGTAWRPLSTGILADPLGTIDSNDHQQESSETSLGNI